MLSIRRALSRLLDPSAAFLAVFAAGTIACFGVGVAAIVVGFIGFVASEVAG